MDSNDSIAYRRELRKKKILENAELRKQKIFGLNNIENNVQDRPNDLKRPALRTTYQHTEKNIALFDEMDETRSTLDDKDETCSTKSFDSQRSSKSQQQEDHLVSAKDINYVNDILRNIPDPISEYEAENTLYGSPKVNFKEKVSSFHEDEEEPLTNYVSNSNNSNLDFTNVGSTFQSKNGGNNSLLSNSNDRSFFSSHPCLLFDILGHPGSPCFLAILVCFVIYMELGNLVSNSLIIPFCLWEIQQIVASYSTVEAKKESTSLIDVALLLCGIQKSIISKYIWLSNLLRDILIDFSMYFVTVVMWNFLIGIPKVKA